MCSYVMQIRVPDSPGLHRASGFYPSLARWASEVFLGIKITKLL